MNWVSKKIENFPGKADLPLQQENILPKVYKYLIKAGIIFTEYFNVAVGQINFFDRME